ncbi:MAG: hypothetical protein R3D70_05995 [Rhizobiaceae bacterium]
MNMRRGLFRLWVLFAGLWALGVGMATWSSVADPYLPTERYLYYPDTDLFHVAPATFNPYSDDTLKELPYPFNTYLHLQSGMTEEQARRLIKRFRAEIIPTREARLPEVRWKNIREGLLFGTVPSVILFALGYAILWAFAGFKQTKPVA